MSAPSFWRCDPIIQFRLNLNLACSPYCSRTLDSLACLLSIVITGICCWAQYPTVFFSLSTVIGGEIKIHLLGQDWWSCCGNEGKRKLTSTEAELIFNQNSWRTPDSSGEQRLKRCRGPGTLQKKELLRKGVSVVGSFILPRPNEVNRPQLLCWLSCQTGVLISMLSKELLSSLRFLVLGY